MEQYFNPISLRVLAALSAIGLFYYILYMNRTVLLIAGLTVEMTILKQLFVSSKTFLSDSLNRHVAPLMPRAIGHLRNCHQYSEWSTTKKGLFKENHSQAGRNEAVLYVHVSKITRVSDTKL